MDRDEWIQRYVDRLSGLSIDEELRCEWAQSAYEQRDWYESPEDAADEEVGSML
jgi:hypothetical protein